MVKYEDIINICTSLKNNSKFEYCNTIDNLISENDKFTLV